jgi:YD repeat-containing protein
MAERKLAPCSDSDPNEACPECAKAGGGGGGGPINLANGNTSVGQTDVGVPGLGGGATLTRMWHSRWPASLNSSRVGMFGSAWRSTYEERIFVADGYYKYARGDGSVWTFAFASNPISDDNQAVFKYSAVSPSNGGGGASLTVTLTSTPASMSWPLTFGNGEQRFFDNKTGNLVAIVDRNGNRTQLSYDSSSRLASVADPAGRHLYFNYAAGGTLVTSVTSDIGITTSYSYDLLSRLVQVTKPDQSTVKYEYDNNSMITAVKDSQGKILESHTYDSSGRGLSSSRANGVGAVTITYPQ